MRKWDVVAADPVRPGDTGTSTATGTDMSTTGIASAAADPGNAIDRALMIEVTSEALEAVPDHRWRKLDTSLRKNRW